MSSKTYRRPLHIELIAWKGYGVTMSFVMLTMLMYWISIPELNIVRVKLPLIHPVEALRNKALISTSLGKGHDRGSENTLPFSKTMPQTIQMITPRDVDAGIHTPSHAAVEWGEGGPPESTTPDGGNRFGSVSTTIGEGSIDSVDEPLEFAEVAPHVDMAALQSMIRYPEVARRNGIEGVVVVRALVSATGEVRKTEIAASDNRLLNEAAMNGVQGASFTPAMQNGHAVSCWIHVPVSFRLSKR